MKKSIFIFVCIFALLLGGCRSIGNTPFVHGLELIEDLEAMVTDEDYLKLYGSISSEYAESVSALRGHNLSKPKYACKVTFDALKFGKQIGGEEFTEEIVTLYESKIAASFVSKINSIAGVESIVLSSCFSTGNSFECKAVEENMVYFYIYESITVAVSFTDGEDDACYAVATLVLNDELDTSGPDALQESLDKFFPECDIKVEKVY